LIDGDPVIQVQLLFLGESPAGGTNSLVLLVGLSFRFFRLEDFDLDLIFLNSPVLTSLSPSAGSAGLIGKTNTELSSSSLNISLNLDACVEVVRLEVREAATIVGDFESFSVEINGSSAFTAINLADVVEPLVVERD
jgi:hypothetical protein